MASSTTSEPHHEWSERNRAFWDTQAKQLYDADWTKRLAKDITDGLQSRVDWLDFRSHTLQRENKQIKMLDYACGTGVASRALAPWVTVFRGIDIAKNMADEYNRLGREAGVDTGKLLAVQGDLGTNANLDVQDAALDTDEFHNFDLIVMSMALHHVDSPPALIQNLVKRLAIRGVLLIIDWTPGDDDNGIEELPAPTLGHHHHDHGGHGDHSHGQDNQHQKHDQAASAHANGDTTKTEEEFRKARHTVSYAGFSELHMQKMFRDAGCVDIGYARNDRSSEVPRMRNGSMYLFFGKARRAAGTV